MTALVLSLSGVTDTVVTQYVRLEHLPAVIGRSPACTVIVPDIYMGAQHYALRASETAGAVCDVCVMDDVNITHLGKKVLRAGVWQALSSGDVLDVGETRLAVYAPSHVVAAAVQMPLQNGAGAVFTRMPVAAMLFVLAMAMTAGWSYLEIWSKEPAMTAAMSVAAVFFVVVVWSALWAVVGRLLTHRSRFATQLSLASVYIVASLVSGTVLRGADFLLSGNMVSTCITLAVQGVLLAALTTACLGAATSLPLRRRIHAAAAFACGLILSMVSLTAIGNMGFSPLPSFATTLSPGLSRVVTAQPIDTFIADSSGLFESDE